ncbi:uncharacterized protein [Rutidosis leptorrhynchoides]|uniref:uncharacterized protein n=1 Tax=Rutidosis leptorrhynchoides TaxID=125765 RepID=UPI003A99FF57
MVWLLIKDKLKTQDRLKPWDLVVGSDGNVGVCPLCKTEPDSRSHLFFACPYATQVWIKAAKLIDIPIVSADWQVWVEHLIPFANRRVVRVVEAKLVIATYIYFIWQERNSRLFKTSSRTLDQLFQVIQSTVRLKLLSVKFKDLSQVRRLKKLWSIS